MNPAPQLSLFEAPGAVADPLYERLCAAGLSPQRRDLADAARQDTLGKLDLAVVIPGDCTDSDFLQQAETLLSRLAAEDIPTLVYGASDKTHWPDVPTIERVDTDTSLDEIAGRLSTSVRYAPLIKRLERELNQLHRLGDQLNRYFTEIDQEMRLAGRLQRDFMPDKLPELAGYDFGLIYRPASWVSGDMYDVFRIDEDHVGLFVADAMGHGVAAGLLTMFIRQALVSKRVSGSSYSVVSPSEALTELQTCLVQQRLPNCQFVTAVYAVLNTRTRWLCLSRAGHPYPMHIHADGRIHQIILAGGLLGLADVRSDFEEVRLRLAPGDKLVLFTDGLEDDFFSAGDRHSRAPTTTPALRDWAHLPATHFAESISRHLDSKVGSLHPTDDITMLALQVRDAERQSASGDPDRF